ncbi:hypothetical protein SprV_0602221700 [Sparganum proliferum]
MDKSVGNAFAGLKNCFRTCMSGDARNSIYSIAETAQLKRSQQHFVLCRSESNPATSIKVCDEQKQACLPIERKKGTFDAFRLCVPNCSGWTNLEKDVEHGAYTCTDSENCQEVSYFTKPEETTFQSLKKCLEECLQEMFVYVRGIVIEAVEAIRTQYAFQGSIVCTDAGIEVIKYNRLIRLRHNRQKEEHILVENEIARRLGNFPAVTVADVNATMESRLCRLRGTVQSASPSVLGRPHCQFQNWFDDDATRTLLAKEKRLHKTDVNNITDKNTAGVHRRSYHVQQRLQETQEDSEDQGDPRVRGSQRLGKHL